MTCFYLFQNPGEGKLTLATSALRKIYDDKKAVGGVWYCRMNGVETTSDIIDRLLTSLSKGGIVTASDSLAGKQAALKTRVNEISLTSAPVYILLDDFEEMLSLTVPPSGESDLLSVTFEHTLSRVMKEVPRLKLVFTSRADVPLG